jgi:hypothetical protein
VDKAYWSTVRIAALINDSKAGAAYDAASAFGGALGSGGGFGS